MEHLKGLSASAIDFELRSLSPMHDARDLKLVMGFLKNGLETKKNFELIEVYLNVFLKVWKKIAKISHKICFYEMFINEKIRKSLRTGEKSRESQKCPFF